MQQPGLPVSIDLGGTLVGEAAQRFIRLLPYRGGPKGFGSTKVDVVYVDESFSTKHCMASLAMPPGLAYSTGFVQRRTVL